MFRILVLVSIVGLCAVPSYGVESFVEMFRGTGPYAGLDNPGWKVSSLGGDDEFTEDGFRIISESLTVDDVQLTVASRDVFDASSFTETLTFKELTFRPPVEDIAHNVVSFSHIMNTSRFSGPESITWIISPRFEDGVEDWSLGMLVEGTPGLGARIPVANEFSVRTTFSESTRMATFVYEYTRDGVSSSIVFGPLQYGGRITNEQRTIASVGANDRGFVAATLHEWTLQPLSDVKGDYDGNGQLGVADIVLLSHAIGTQSTDAIFDLNGDGVLNDQDLGVWIRDLGDTYFGDANLDGEFSSADLINVFQAGEYEDDLVANSTWSSGDWNGDGEFTTSDMVIAFQDGGYEQGPRSSVSSVPEPTAFLGLVIGGMLSLFSRSRR